MAKALNLREAGQKSRPVAPLRAAAKLGLRALPPSDAGEAARQLYRATLDLLRRSDDPCAQRHVLLEPLSRAVAMQKTRAGHLQCRAVAESLGARDYDGALDACIRLVELSTPPVEGGEA